MATGTVSVRNSELTENSHAVYRGTGATVRVANFQLSGPVAAGVICFSNHDGNFSAVTCP